MLPKARDYLIELEQLLKSSPPKEIDGGMYRDWILCLTRDGLLWGLAAQTAVGHLLITASYCKDNDEPVAFPRMPEPDDIVRLLKHEEQVKGYGWMLQEYAAKTCMAAGELATMVTRVMQSVTQVVEQGEDLSVLVPLLKLFVEEAARHLNVLRSAHLVFEGWIFHAQA